MEKSTLVNDVMFELARVNDVFADFYKQLEEAKKVNEQTVFQYETPAGNKAARSHVYKLRQSKSALATAHKKAKAKPLEFSRALDSEKKKLISEIEEMISVHELPLKEIEDREKERITDIQTMIDNIQFAGFNDDLSTYKVNTSAEFKVIYDEIFDMVIGEDFAEFKTVAFEAKDGTLKRLLEKIAELKKSEDEAAELDRLRKESAEREQKEHDDRIAREAKAEAERIANEAAMRKEFEAKAEQERIEREKKEAIEKAEFEKQQAIDNAELAKREQIAQEERAKIEREQAIESKKLAVAAAEQAVIDRQNAKEQRLISEQLKREANKRNIGNIRRQAKESIMELGFSEVDAKKLVMAIHNKDIANVSINY
jgi:hypothetical protein